MESFATAHIKCSTDGFKRIDRDRQKFSKVQKNILKKASEKFSEFEEKLNACEVKEEKKLTNVTYSYVGYIKIWRALIFLMKGKTKEGKTTTGYRSLARSGMGMCFFDDPPEENTINEIKSNNFRCIVHCLQYIDLSSPELFGRQKRVIKNAARCFAILEKQCNPLKKEKKQFRDAEYFYSYRGEEALVFSMRGHLLSGKESSSFPRKIKTNGSLEATIKSTLRRKIKHIVELSSIFDDILPYNKKYSIDLDLYSLETAD